MWERLSAFHSLHTLKARMETGKISTTEYFSNGIMGFEVSGKHSERELNLLVWHRNVRIDSLQDVKSEEWLLLYLPVNDGASKGKH